MDSSLCYILVLNGGSSSLKFALFRNEPNQNDTALTPSLSGQFKRIGQPAAQLKITDSVSGKSEQRAVVAPNHTACLEPLRFTQRGGLG